MATNLKAQIQFPVVQPGAQATLLHGLNWQSLAVVPDTAEPDHPAFAVVVALTDDTNLTIQNNGLVAASCIVLVESWHSIERAFGDPTTTTLAVQPFQAAAPVVPVGVSELFADDGLLVNVYVDGANGDDGNDGLTALTALQTIQTVYRKFPLHVYQRSQIRVNMAGVGGFGADATGVLQYDISTLICNGGGSIPYENGYQYLGPEMVPVTPASGPATAALDAVPCVAVLGGAATAGGTLSSRFDFTGAAPGWTVDDLAGKFLRITRAGAKVTWELPIARNTADTITVRLNGIAALFVAATDTAEIVEPAVQFFESIVGYGQVIIGLGGNGGNQLGCSFVRCCFYEGFEVRGDGITFDRCDLDYQGWGCYLLGDRFDMVLCVGQYLFIGGRGGGFGTYPLETGAADPIVANRPLRMTLQLNPVYGWMDIFGDFWANESIGVDSFYTQCVWVYAGGMLVVEDQGLFGHAVTAIQGVCDNAGSWLVCYNGGQARLPSNVANPGATSVYGSGGGDPLELYDGPGLTCDYGIGAGDWEEVAGFAGCLYLPPSAGVAGDPTTCIRVSQY